MCFSEPQFLSCEKEAIKPCDSLSGGVTEMRGASNDARPKTTVQGPFGVLRPCPFSKPPPHATGGFCIPSSALPWAPSLHPALRPAAEFKLLRFILCYRCFQKSLPLLESQIRESHQSATDELRQCGEHIPSSDGDKMFFLIEVRTGASA